MHPKVKILVRIVILLLVMLLASKPYNLFCTSSSKCQPFYLSDFIPRNEGKAQIDVDFVIDNYRDGLKISPMNKRLETVSNRITAIQVKVKNISPKAITFKPKLKIEPQEYKNYVELYECLCSSKIKLKVGEEKILKMRFSIDKDFDDLIIPRKLQSEKENGLLRIKYRIDAR